MKQFRSLIVLVGLMLFSACKKTTEIPNDRFILQEIETKSNPLESNEFKTGLDPKVVTFNDPRNKRYLNVTVSVLSSRPTFWQISYELYRNDILVSSVNYKTQNKAYKVNFMAINYNPDPNDPNEVYKLVVMSTAYYINSSPKQDIQEVKIKTKRIL